MYGFDSEHNLRGSEDEPQHLVTPGIQAERMPQRSVLRKLSKALLLLVIFLFGLGSGYLLWGRSPAGNVSNEVITPSVSQAEVFPVSQINPPGGYMLPVSFGDIGPQLIASGAIDLTSFLQVYEQAGRPLTEEQIEILTNGSDAPIVIDRENAYFLLNFFWAFGLTNQNALLEEGPMMKYGEDEVGRFASTGGWTIGTKPATELYASTPIITLIPEQQARLEEVASAVYRPCCNNPTAFPDCNHGMAMLGLFELMASQGASADEMFEAAKYVNAYWFPQQTTELAIFFKNAKGLDFTDVDARQLVGQSYSSGAGFGAVHQWLQEHNLLQQGPNSGNSCGV